jgi:hypothetical protein
MVGNDQDVLIPSFGVLQLQEIHASCMGVEVWIGTNSAAGTTNVFLQIQLLQPEMQQLKSASMPAQ